jgi:hypothetical protein
VNSRFALLPLAAALLALAACASPTPGTGTPASTTEAPISSGSSPSSAASDGLAAIQPCDLISSAQASQNNLQPEGPSNAAGARSCNWSNASADNGLGYALEVDLRDTQGLADVNTDGLTISDDPIGHHQAKQAERTSDGDCLVIIGVTSKSRVDVTLSTSASNLTEACSLANQYARLIEPELH